ncbi:glycosyltransferase family 39 protein, partial [Streptomyces boncukensis]
MAHAQQHIPRAPAGREAARGGRLGRLFLGHRNDPRRARPALWAILALAALLYLWNLSALGQANSFYSAAVYSGTQSWKAFFYGALDAGSFITVDKPPFALWVMGLSCRVFGFGTWQMMLPMAAAGVASVALLHRMVRSCFGHAAAAVAALVLALTPMTVAITRDNNPDPILVLLMLLGAAGTLKAIRTGTLLPLVWAGVAFGFAFHTKMLQAFIPVPALFLAYLLAARTTLGRRVRNLAVAGAALIVSGGWWMVVVDRIPAGSRPFIGGSEDNTVWNLVLGYNGLGRVFG